MTEFTIAGRRVRGLRHGMAGQPGFELFGPWEDGDAVLDALLRAGENHGLVRVGSKAYSTANLGSGWVPAPMPALFSDDPLMQEYREWLPVAKVGSIGGSLDSADIADYYLTPYDIGYGKTVKFDHDFIGRAALERLSQTAPPRTKVTLVWNADDVTAAIGSLYRPGPGAKYIDMPKARYATHHEDKVLKDGAQVGISLDCGYLANEREMVSLATIDTALQRARAPRWSSSGASSRSRPSRRWRSTCRSRSGPPSPRARTTRPGHLPVALTAARPAPGRSEPGAGRRTRGRIRGRRAPGPMVPGASTVRAQAGCGARLSNRAMPAAVLDAGTK